MDEFDIPNRDEIIHEIVEVHSQMIHEDEELHDYMIDQLGDALGG